LYDVVSAHLIPLLDVREFTYLIPLTRKLGTVIGIIDAFQGMNALEGTGIKAVAGGISEALIETAFGLIVAIPAVWTFNHFSSKRESFRVEMNNSASELTAYLKRHQRNDLENCNANVL
jgi:MotA/TolQ/ExbB proton channel family protein